jgi:phage gp36-like protein
VADYITEQELIDAHLPADVEKESSPAQRTTQITAASATADSYLRTAGYAVPLSSWGADLTWTVGAIAAFRLASKLGLLPQPAHQSDLYLNHKAAVAWFEDVAAGRISLDLADADGGAKPSHGPRVTSDDRRGW